MAFDQQLIKGSVSILVLKLLADCDMYGYQIIKELEKRSHHAFSLKEGTLYPVLHGLETDGYIVSYWEGNARKRRIYHVTDKGSRLLTQKQSEWLAFTSAVNQVLQGGGQVAQMCF